MSKHPREHDDGSGRPRRSLFRRFDDFAMRFYGPAVRSPRDLRGAEASAQTRQWYQDLQQEYVVEKDANGHTYLRPRRPQDGPATPPEDSP